uniref:Transthyretin-like family protein n=1 Tax=Roseihalotalea indica TaxID=2867963 RepID=A0AA49GU95_9BACT|nr:transthyretin-like family protein [Tunicatimonas sp. TK19036]
MNYIIRGHLCAYLCDDCREDVSQAIIRLYRLDSQNPDNVRVAADPKETLQVLSEKAVEAKEKRLLAEATADAQGNFEFRLNGDRLNYNGEAVEVDVLVKAVPNQKKQKKKHDPVQFTITVWQPKWRESGNDLIASWEYCLPARFWCGIRSLFDAWVICGRIIDCKNNQTPVANVKVTAFDADWLKDDVLGAAITDASGHFRIDYTSIDFKQTFLSPVINVETPFPPFNSGPDVYFKVETTGTPSTIFLAEGRKDGRVAGRENIGPCFCIDLCVDPNLLPPPSQFEPALFTHVGAYDILTQIDADGFTNDSQKNVFTRDIPLNGDLPGGYASNEMEYRFRIVNVNTSTELSAAQVINLIQPTIIGSVQRRFPHDSSVPDSIPSIGYYRVFPFYLKKPGETYNVDPDINGWIKVPRLNNLDTTGVFTASYGSGVSLAIVDTEQLFTQSFDLNTPSVHVAGNTMSAADRFAGSDPTFRVIFEAREVGTASLSSTNILNKMVVWNGVFTQTRHPSWVGGVVNLKGVCMADISEIIGSGSGCKKLTGTVNARYTCYHPFIESATLQLTSNTVPPPVNLTIDSNHESSGINTYTGLTPCAYILKLTAYYRLTSGYGRNSDAFDRDEIAFCVGA